MKTACNRASAMLAQRRSGLTGSARLRLEGHLADCQDCRHDAHLLEGLTGLSDASVVTLAPEQRAGALRRALLVQQAEPARPSLWGAQWALGLAGAAALSVGLWLTLVQTAPGPQGAVAVQAETVSESVAQPSPEAVAVTVTEGSEGDVRALSGDRLVAGQVAELEPGMAVSRGALLRARPGATLALAHAQVVFKEASHARWQPAESTLLLEQGSVFVEVDPRPGEAFQVRTPRFEVQVLGTRFEVRADSVEVFEGRVRVRALDGQVLAPGRVAGQRWELAGSKAAGSSGSTRPPASTSELLGEARALLAQQRVRQAERAVRRALAAGGTRGERAEAYTLRAEAALVRGDRRAAIKAYLVVARRYAGLAAAENALFAAARLQARSGDRTAARESLERYLQRYPKGRFEREVRRRLADGLQ